MALSLLIVAQVLMQAFSYICSTGTSDYSSFYCTNFGSKFSNATRCFRALVDCHFNNSVSLTPAECLVLLSCTVFKLRISFSARCGKVSCCLKMFLYIGSRIKFHNDQSIQGFIENLVESYTTVIAFPS